MESEQRMARDVFNAVTAVDEAAQKWKDDVVFYHYESDGKITYGEVPFFMNRVGNALRSAGVEMENRVAFLLDDSFEYCFAVLGALKIGAVPTPLNTLLSEEDYAFFLNDSRAKVLFLGASYIEKIKNILPSPPPFLKLVVVLDGDVPEQSNGLMVSWNDFLKDASAELDVAPTLASDLALFAYTSGSTGRPRAMMHSHGNLEAGSLGTKREVFGLEKGDIQFYIPKLYFLTSLTGMVASFSIGCPIIFLTGRPTAPTVLDLVARYRPSFLAGVPTIMARMMDAAKDGAHSNDLSSVQYIFCTGELVSKELFQQFKNTFGKQIYNNWGCQELIAAPLSWRPHQDVPLEKVGSVGKTPWIRAEVKITDENGNQVADGVPGEIMFRTPSHFLGYWHEPQESTRKFVEGWYKPGDSFVRDKDGYYWYHGRLDDMVKIAGRQIFPVEIEQVIGRHRAVLENAVLPMENELSLSELEAFVVVREGYTPSAELATEIQTLVKNELAPFKRPQRVEFVSALPRTGTGKVQRFRLKEQMLEARKKRK